MKQSLQLRLGQQLTMTPQLQQAIRLLQLSSLDLQVEIQTLLDSNLMLERSDDLQEIPVQPDAQAAQTAADASAEICLLYTSLHGAGTADSAGKGVGFCD